MAEITYTAVVWTAGDIITEAKMDNMVANDRAVDAMALGVRFTERAKPDTPPGNTVHLYAKDKAGVPCLYAINDVGTEYELSEYTPTFVFPVTGALVTGVSLTTALIAIKALTIVKAYAYVKTAPTGADLIIDINKNGTSIWNSNPTNRLKINGSTSSGNQTTFGTTSLIEGDILTLDIDQVGSSVAGSDLVVELKTK